MIDGEHETIFDLDKYAAQDEELGAAPNIETHPQEFADWQTEVENAFHEEWA